jgi:hypothetical protein
MGNGSNAKPMAHDQESDGETLRLAFMAVVAIAAIAGAMATIAIWMK